MALAQSHSLRGSYYLVMMKSFLIWTFTLAVCSLVIGFPLLVLVVSVGSLLAVSLHALMPISSVLFITGSILGLFVAGTMFCAALLTVKGIHPQDVTWLRWLQGEEDPLHTSVYAACPLSCDVKHL